MHARTPLPARLADLAHQQAGLLTRAQLLGTGLSPSVTRRLAREWVTLRAGVYLTQPALLEPAPLGAPLDRWERDWLGLPWRTRAWGGLLAGGAGARLSHRSAAYLDRLVDRSPDRIDVLVPGPRHPRDSGPWHFRREIPGIRLAGSPAGVPRTHAPDTVLDLCAGGDSAAVLTHLARAAQKGVPLDVVHEQAVRRATMRHRRLVMAVLDDVGRGQHSHLEREWRLNVADRHGLTGLAYQFAVPGSGRRADVAHPVGRVLVELDGREFHGPGRARHDRSRDTVHAVAGWLTLRQGWNDATASPCSAAGAVVRVVRGRGAQIDFTPCDECRNDRTLSRLSA